MATNAKPTKPRNDKTSETVATAADATTAQPSTTSEQAAPAAHQDDVQKDENVTSDKPVSAPPSRPADDRIMALAGTIALEFGGSATVDQLAAHLGYETEMVSQLLTAMAFAKAAVSQPDDPETGEIRWTLGTAKPASVDPANLPPCPTCGLVPPAIRANGSATKRATNGNGVKQNGSRPGELSRAVRRYIDAHPGHLTASMIAKALTEELKYPVGTGSVTYAIDKLLIKNELAADPRKIAQ